MRQKKRARVAEAFAACRSAFLGLGLFGMVVNLLMLTGPLFMLQVYDRVLTSRSIPTLVVLGGLAFALYAFLGIIEFVRSRVLVRISRRLDEQLSDVTFDSAIALSLQQGRSAQKIDPLRDLDLLRQFISSPGPLAIFDIPWMPIYLAIIFLFHQTLGLLAVFGAGLLILLTLLNEISSSTQVAETNQHGTQRSSLFSAGQRNSEVLFAMGMLVNFRKKWSEKNREFNQAQNQAGDHIAFFSSLTKTTRFIMQSAMLGVGAYLAIRQEITPGVMIASSIMLSRALAPVELAIAHWRGFIGARQSLQRLNSVFNALGKEIERTNLPHPTRELIVSNLSIAPPGERITTLQNVNFNLKAGDALGVIGPSASGKSTLARSLVGVWPSSRGEIRIDGAALDQWEPDQLGNYIGYLPQDIELFQGTVAENISRFEDDAEDEAIIEAAHHAGVHNIILQLNDGYDTEIGPHGAALSAGQRQRIGLARALYKKPFLIVLDEPNSNLDADGDLALAKAVQSARQRGAIVVVVAHRPSAITQVNKILVLAEGKQKSFGLKEDVLQKTTHRKNTQNPGTELETV